MTELAPQDNLSLSLADLKDLDGKTAVIVGGSIAFGMLLSSFVFQQVTAHEERILDDIGYEVIIDPDYLEMEGDKIVLKKRPQAVKKPSNKRHNKEG